MKKSRIIIADMDENFLIPLETKFLYELGDEVELEVISDISYYNEYFANPKAANCVLVSDKLFSLDLQKHDIDKLVVMTDQNGNTDAEGHNFSVINKYTSIDDIYEYVVSVISGNLSGAKQKETLVAMVYSAAGGTGKTTIAMGLCESLSTRYKKILYINAENINSFQYMMKDDSRLSLEVSAALAMENEHLLDIVKANIRNEGFDYLPPFATALVSMNLDLSLYEKIISAIKTNGEYDAIIIDTDSSFELTKASMIAKADKVYVITTQSKASVYAMNSLTRNISCNNRNKFYFVCNDFDETKYNAIEDPEYSPDFAINEYVKHIPEIDKKSIKELGENGDIKKLSFLIM